MTPKKFSPFTLIIAGGQSVPAWIIALQAGAAYPQLAVTPKIREMFLPNVGGIILESTIKKKKKN